MADTFLPQNPRRRINARPRNVEYEEGTGPGTGRTARRVDPSVGSSAGNRSGNLGGGLDAFYLAQRDKTRSMGDINREATIGREQGLMYNPKANQYQFNSMYNRNSTTNPLMQQQNQMQQAGQQMGQQAGQQAASTVVSGINPMMGSAMGLGMQLANTALGGGSGGFNPSNPMLSARDQNIAKAKSSGQFDKIREEYNKKNKGSGISMDEAGTISRSPFMAARDAVANKLREQQQQGMR